MKRADTSPTSLPRTMPRLGLRDLVLQGSHSILAERDHSSICPPLQVGRHSRARRCAAVGYILYHLGNSDAPSATNWATDDSSQFTAILRLRSKSAARLYSRYSAGFPGGSRSGKSRGRGTRRALVRGLRCEVLHDEDAMAADKLAEGIRKFSAGARVLVQYAQSRVAKMASSSNPPRSTRSF